MNRARRAVKSIRGRSAMLAMLIVLGTLLAGSFLLLRAYEGQLVANLDSTLEQQVLDRARLIENGGPKESLTTVLQDEAFVWIGSVSGDVTAQGGAIVPLENPVPATIGTTVDVTLLVEERASDENERERMELRIASTQAATGQVVIAGAERETVDRAVASLARLFALAIPIMVVIVGALGWFLTDRALRPVDAIRSQAEMISGSTLAERVPVPESGDEIEELATTVNQMLDRLEAHDTSIRQFSSDASHELKSPIANIRALVETRTSTDPDWVTVQHKLTGETNRLGDLVDNLLFLASYEDIDRPIERSPVALDELVFSEAELVSSTTELRVDLSGVAPTTIQASVTDLSRLLRNLVDNAVRHGNERIAIALISTDDYVEIIVSDDGPGVPERERDRVFERFTRLDEARARDAGGTGLGLSIVAQIARAHEGDVSISSSPLGGAAFTVRLRSSL
jgi:signal transduction histidine kinase